MTKTCIFAVAFACIGVANALAAEPAAEAQRILQTTGVCGGIIVHLGCGDGRLTAALRADERYLVHGLDADPARVEKAREHVRSLGLYGPVSIDRWSGAGLPYVDNLVNMILCEPLAAVPQEEILRVLAPRGVALIGDRQIVKPWPKQIDEWTHFLHGPDNNAVARDRVAGNPRSMQWIAGPRWGRSHEELASLSAAVTARGRLFYILDEAPLASIRFTGQWKLVARDAFNGLLLWKRPVGPWIDHLRHFRAGPVHLPRRLVAEGDRVYVTLGLASPVTALDAATGQTLRTFEGTEHTEEIVASNGILYLAVGTSEAERRGGGLSRRGEPEPAGFRFVAAVDAESSRTLWKKTFGKDESLLPQTLAVSGQRAFFQTTAGLVCLDARSGNEHWRTPRPTPARRMSFSAPTLVAAGEVVLLADREPGNKQNAAAGTIEWGVHGWNEPGFDRSGKCTLRAYAAGTGKELWSAPCSEGYNSPVDVFVVHDTVWVGANYAGYDLKTGEPRGTLHWKGDAVGMPHHRCYRNKATEEYLFAGRSGVEVVSFEQGWLSNNSWLRGTCQYGIVPANGLVYAPPNACACYGKVKTPGFFAAAPQRGTSLRMPLPAAPVLEKGPAYAQMAKPEAARAAADDWPTYRHDPARSGAIATSIPAELKPRWSASVGGRLTQPVIAAGALFVASSDAHAIHALDAKDGRPLWRFTAGGRIDSPPTIHQGRVLFGSADGWIYAVRAADGALAWRFRAAPQDRLAGAYDQLESVWPAHGAVLVQNGVLYAAAGRSSYLDGGIVLYALDPATGKQLARHVVCHLDPETGRQIGKEGREVGPFDMEGVYSDVLSGDGDSVFLKHLRFDKQCRPIAETKPHLFAVTGFLGEEWFVRSYWLVGENVGAGWGGWAQPAGSVPFGRILCFDEDSAYGYGRVKISGGATGHRADAYHLYARDRAAAAPGADAAPAGGRKGQAKAAGKADAKRAAAAWAPPRWSDANSSIVRAMVLTGDRLVVAGPPDLAQKQEGILALANEDEAMAGFDGRKGVMLRVVSARDGATRFQTALPAMPVFDGLSAAGGAVFVALKDGSVLCLGGY